MIPMQKTKCASRAQMLGFAPYLCTWEGRKLQNWSGALLSAHLACKLQTLLAKCASRAQAKCALKSAPDRLVRTTLAPDRTKLTLIPVWSQTLFGNGESPNWNFLGFRKGITIWKRRSPYGKFSHMVFFSSIPKWAQTLFGNG
jgi:hypothetical protein